MEDDVKACGIEVATDGSENGQYKLTAKMIARGDDCEDDSDAFASCEEELEANDFTLSEETQQQKQEVKDKEQSHSQQKVSDFTDKVNFYVMSACSFFKSMWPEIKSNAALFVGYMLGNLPKDKSGIVSKEHVCEALILLLRDPQPLVRSCAAEAMSLLCEY